MSRNYKKQRAYKRSFARTMGRRDAHRRSNRIERRNTWFWTKVRRYLLTGNGLRAMVISVLMPAVGAYMLYQSAETGNIFQSGALIFFALGVPLTFIVWQVFLLLIRAILFLHAIY